MSESRQRQEPEPSTDPLLTRWQRLAPNPFNADQLRAKREQAREVYSRLPGLEALEKEVSAAKHASAALLLKQDPKSEAYRLLLISESRLFGYLLIFNAAYRAVNDALKVAYRREIGKPLRGMGVRRADIIEDYALGLECLEASIAPEPGPDLPGEVRERLKMNRELFVEATKVLAWISENPESPAGAIHNQVARPAEGHGDYWLSPYGVHCDECDAA